MKPTSADDEEVLASEARGKPSDRRGHDRGRDDVGRQHPGDLVATRATACPAYSGSATLAIVWSSACISVAIMVQPHDRCGDAVDSFVAASRRLARSRLAALILEQVGQCRAYGRYRYRPLTLMPARSIGGRLPSGRPDDPHRNALHHLHPVAAGVLRRQDRECPSRVAGRCARPCRPDVVPDRHRS